MTRPTARALAAFALYAAAGTAAAMPPATAPSPATAPALDSARTPGPSADAAAASFRCCETEAVGAGSTRLYAAATSGPASLRYSYYYRPGAPADGRAGVYFRAGHPGMRPPVSLALSGDAGEQTFEALRVEGAGKGTEVALFRADAALVDALRGARAARVTYAAAGARAVRRDLDVTGAGRALLAHARAVAKLELVAVLKDRVAEAATCRELRGPDLAAAEGFALGLVLDAAGQELKTFAPELDDAALRALVDGARARARAPGFAAENPGYDARCGRVLTAAKAAVEGLGG